MRSRVVSVLGSTGSIGVSTLDLLDQLERAGEAQVRIAALAAGRNVERLAEQARRWRPDLVVVADESCLPELRERLAGEGLRVEGGQAAVIEAAAGVGADWVMAAIVGAAGLAPTLAAARTGATVALANKESLVCAGPDLLAIARAAGGEVIPVDSEHSAIFQVFSTEARARVARLILTASGGPFRTWAREAMAAASPEQAVAHPNWSMGAKISVDSASMMNKGLEMIEASYLFDLPEPQVDVVVHPQSVVHSLLEYADGSTLAQLGPPDMKSPISVAFAWPERVRWAAEPLDLPKIASLTFEAPDPQRFPALALARQALREGAWAPAALNAANERGVSAFLNRSIGFLDIAAIVSETLEQMTGYGANHWGSGDAVEAALAVDADARTTADGAIARLAARR